MDGDAELQQAIRFALFHVLQSAARGNRDPIPAKGLTGAGYDGHAFWDSEIYVLPVLTYLYPPASLAALRWRWRTLPFARDRAEQLGLDGAAFPWRTIHGEECSGYWPAGTAAFHVNAGIAHATKRYIAATGDEEFARNEGLELLVETARLWRSLGHHDAAGHFRIDGVTGPDEYSAIADNNMYTNVMAQLNLSSAAEAVEKYPEEAAEHGVDEEEAASWRDAATAMVIPFDEHLGVHEQAEGFTNHARWDFEDTSKKAYPLFLSYPYYDIYRKQVVKQADLILAIYLRGDLFDARAEARRLLLLRGADRARLLAVRLRAVDRRGRGRLHRPRLRLPGGGGADGPARRRLEQRQRPPHGLARRGLARCRLRSRRHARQRRQARLLRRGCRPRCSGSRSGSPSRAG